MRTMTEAQYERRMAHRARRARARTTRRWALAILALMGLGLLQVTHAHAASGGRIQPRVAPANPTFIRAVEWRMNDKVHGPLLQDCMHATCEVYRADGGVMVTFKRRDGVWRIATMIGGEGDGAYQSMR